MASFWKFAQDKIEKIYAGPSIFQGRIAGSTHSGIDTINRAEFRRCLVICYRARVLQSNCESPVSQFCEHEKSGWGWRLIRFFMVSAQAYSSLSFRNFSISR